MSLVDRIEALARAKGWHADQNAHGPADCWMLRHAGRDAGMEPFVWLYPPDDSGVLIDQITAALWILLAVSGLPDVDMGPCERCNGDGVARLTVTDRHNRLYQTPGDIVRCPGCQKVVGRDLRSPAQLVLDASRPKRRGSGVGGQSSLATEVDHDARDALAQLASRIRDEAHVLADRWQTDGVGLSTGRVRRPPDALIDFRCGVADCTGRAEWWTRERAGEWYVYCHGHRPSDGLGDKLAAALQNGDPYEVPPEHCPGRGNGADGYSPMLWSMIERWLNPNRYEAGLRDDLGEALVAALTRAGGAAEPERPRVPLHVRLDQALRAGRTWMVMEPGDVVPGQRTVGLGRAGRDQDRARWLDPSHLDVIRSLPPLEEFTFDVRWINDGTGAVPLAVLRGTRLPSDVQVLTVAPPRR